MKVVLVSGRLSYSIPAIYTVSIARGLAARGHEVQLLTWDGPLRERLDLDLEEGSLEVIRIREGFLTRRKLVNFVREFEPDVVHTTGGARALQLADRIAHAVDAPLIHTVHSWLAEDQSESYPSSVDAFLVLNQTLREHLVNERNVPKSQVRVVPYGVEEYEGFEEAAPQVAGQIPVVGTLGRLSQGRRHDEFIRAAALVRERYPDVLFAIVGEGPNEASLRKLVKELGLSDALTFLQPRGSVDLFSVLDLVVIVADWGGVGLTLLEAMAHGCPVIATGGGEVFSLLTKDDTCALVPSGERERLADEIIALLEDPERRQQLATNAREHIQANYPIQSHLHSLVELYENLLSTSEVD